MMSPTPAIVTDIGLLASRGESIIRLRKAISLGSTNIRIVCNTLISVIRDGDWNQFTERTGDLRFFKPHEFRRFISDPEGLGSSIEEIDRLIRDHPEARVAFHEAIRGPAAPEAGEARNPSGVNGHTKDSHDDVMAILDPETPESTPLSEVTESESTIPDETDVELDGNAESPSSVSESLTAEPAPLGNSVNYAVRRLGKNRPDLLDEVKTGKLSPHAAMVKAGFRPKMLQLKAEPEAAARILSKHLDDDQIRELIAELEAVLASRSVPV